MNFKEKDIKISYKNGGENKISDIINELLYITKSYKRSVGFFDSSALDFISSGLLTLASNKGTIQLITSPKLTKEDVEAIQSGYLKKENALYDTFKLEFEQQLNKFDDENLNHIVDLITYNILNIKIANKKNLGMYHDKVAILTDHFNNKVAFVGSNNETASGYDLNWEKARVFKGWELKDYVEDEERDFDKIWNNLDEELETYDFRDAIKKDIIEYQSRRSSNQKKEKYKLYKYQEEAVDSWVNNNYKGFFVMATGTGKTITALYSAKKVIDKEKVFTVIAVPYKHLVSQWYEDIRDIFQDSCQIFKVSSEIPEWENKIKDGIFSNKLTKKHKNIILITTISSFCKEKFQKILEINKEKTLLIVDEAHNFLNKIRDKSLNLNFDYKLGLSATPIFGNDLSKTKELCDFFGGVVYDLPIEKAIGKFLVNYSYTPIFVNASEDEESKFNHYRKKMMQCRNMETGEIVNLDEYIRAHRGKLRVIANVEEKINGISRFIDTINEPDHFIIYCSDGKTDEGRYLNLVIDLLNQKGFKPSQFTCEENMKERESLIENFDKGYISTLVAIKCLDEGINIKSIKSALILSSNDNYREFVQRRGRILRLYEGKTLANIIDIIVLPSKDCKAMAEIEFRRFYEYARLAINSEELLSKLEQYLIEYDLTMDDIKFVTLDNEEGELDE